MANEKKCEACLGKIEGHPSVRVEHPNGRRGVIHANVGCKIHAERQGWKELA